MDKEQMKSSFKSTDVELLLKDITGLVDPMPTREREILIQNGTHYCEMLPLEYRPSADYVNIYNKALEFINNNKTLLDLYCGTGTIGIWLNNKFDSITGVEINESSIKNANINKKLNKLNNIEFICSDAKNIEGVFDTIVVDPPRNGLSKDVIKYLNESNTKEIVYISCNPNTLKRDIDMLDKYEVKHISCADMFPRTKHIETVCILERK